LSQNKEVSLNDMDQSHIFIVFSGLIQSLSNMSSDVY